jgi:hypothetical protein
VHNIGVTLISLKTYLLFFIFLYIGVFLISCAKVVAPVGGPKDTEPPEILNVFPEAGTVNFFADKISFRFNEFFTLKNPSRNIFLNPLTNEEIRYVIRGKQLIIRLPDSLKNNQTYTLILDNVVADFHEGNVLSTLKYVFSTGSHIDSLGIRGKVLDAQTDEPVEDVHIYLFPANADSLLLKRQFAWMSVSAGGGQFEFTNLPEDEYSLYALSDKDYDHTYSSRDEKPGFYPATVRTSLHIVNDSVTSGMTVLEKPIYIFKEHDSTIRMLKSAFVRKGLFHIILNQPVSRANIVAVEENVADKLITTTGKKGDTLSLWIIGQKADFGSFIITADEQLVDTISLNLKPPSRGVTPTTEPVKMSLRPANTFDNNRFHYSDTLIIASSSPITLTNSDSIFIIRNNDTVHHDILFSPDNPMEIMILFDVLPGSKYEAIIHQGSLIDCFGTKNDSAFFMVQSTDPEYYSKLILKIDGQHEDCVNIELAGTWKTYTYQFAAIPENEQFEFSGLIPGDYVIRLVSDTNCNGKWDTGHFNERIKPEKVFRLPGKTTIRSNWENEILWSLE